jgi:putative ABC transport system permease protein
MEIVGVVGNVKNQGIQMGTLPEIYSSYLQWPWHYPILVVRSSSDPAVLIDSIREQIESLTPGEPIADVRPLSQYLTDAGAQPRLRALVTSLFAVVALLLASVGIYGVVSYGVSQRKREMGIRIALGAKTADIFRHVVGQSMIFALSGIAAGLLGSFWLTRLISSLLYQVEAADLWTYSIVSLVLVVCALVACCVPARRAIKVDPMLVLRQE